MLDLILHGGVITLAALEGEAQVFSLNAMEELRAWRLPRARGERMPAFRIMTDQSLLLVASNRPQTLAELGSLRGIGTRFIDKFGDEVLDLLLR